MNAAAGSNPSRRDRKRQSTRGAIVAAGETLFANRALEGVSVDEIVAVADLAKGSFYNHFTDKTGLAEAIVETVRLDLEARIAEANAGVQDAAATMCRALCVALRYAAEYPDRAAAMVNLSARKTVADAPLNQALVQALHSGLRSGQFQHITVESGVLVVMGTIQITLRHVMTAGSATPPALLAAAMAAAMLRGLGVDAARAEHTARDAAAAIKIGGDS